MNNNFFSRLFQSKNNLEQMSLSRVFKKVEKDLTDNEKLMILKIAELNKFLVKDIMVPRIDVVSIDKNTNIKEIIKIINQKGYSRLPVYEKNIDNIIGILHSKDLLKSFLKEATFNLDKIIREAIFVPESKLISDLLIDLRNKKKHLAIVVDEYGGMSGIVCLEDILEKIVGEIQDEFDTDSDEIQKINDYTYLINSRTTIAELNEKLDMNISEEEIDTLGGLLYMISGKIPVVNEKISYKNYLFTVESISGRQIKSIKLEIQNKEDVKNNKNS